MIQPRVVLCTLVLNETEWIPRLYAQHRDWPGLERWVFVEAADREYAWANPDRVSPRGLSVDGTTAMLHELSRSDPRVVHVRHGFTEAKDPSQGKCAARSRYLRSADEVRPDLLVVLDADEFYARDDQQMINDVFAQDGGRHNSFAFRWRNVWRPPTIADRPLFELEAVGQVWSVTTCRVWRWFPSLRYASNHNTPETEGGQLLTDSMSHHYRSHPRPVCVHMGFTSSLESRAAKHKYYQARGEGRTDHRRPYVECRRAFETWRPGDKLPHGAKVLPYTGPVPEIFQEERR